MSECKAAAIVILVLIGLVYAWIASGVRTFTHPAELLTGLPIVAVAIILVIVPRVRRNSNALPARWLLPWFALAFALFAWEMYELFSKPRRDYPTISSIGDSVLRTSRLTHALAFAAWLAVGAYLGRRVWMRRSA